MYVKIAVCVKQAIDIAQLRIDEATMKPLTALAPRKMSDIDRNALEEAVRIKNQFNAHVIAITLGSEKAREVLREALAIGADEACLIQYGKPEELDTGLTAKALAAAMKRLGPFDLIICGEATTDTFSGQVGPRIAEILDIPCITYVRSVKIEGKSAVAERDLEDRYEVVKAEMPLLITVTKEINVPRLPPLIAILRASRKPLKMLNITDLGIEVKETRVEVVDVTALKVRRKMHIIKDKPIEEAVEELVSLLVKEGVV